MLAMQTRALCLVLLLAATAIPAQQPAKSPAAPAVSAPNGQTSANAGSAPVRAYAFEVISIRRNKTPTTLEVLAHDGPTADGYRNHSPLLLPLLTAYVPQAGGAAFYTFDQIKGIPDWLVGERYDVDARIADQDRAKWKKPAAQKAMLASMLQSLLTDRCKLAVHREMKETQVTSLMVAKGGPKFKETDPTVEHPDGQRLPFGGVIVLRGEDGMSLYDISMASFASFLSSQANEGRPVQDKTGLSGRYDITFKSAKRGEPADDEDPGSSEILSGLNNLGLKLDSEKGQVETLVIDYMERPSDN
jgi:uncharacterized protein (TIGR03435 family)